MPSKGEQALVYRVCPECGQGFMGIYADRLCPRCRHKSLEKGKMLQFRSGGIGYSYKNGIVALKNCQSRPKPSTLLFSGLGVIGLVRFGKIAGKKSQTGLE